MYKYDSVAFRNAQTDGVGYQLQCN